MYPAVTHGVKGLVCVVTLKPEAMVSRETVCDMREELCAGECVCVCVCVCDHAQVSQRRYVCTLTLSWMQRCSAPVCMTCGVLWAVQEHCE
jgi:hypothetical protein